MNEIVFWRLDKVLAETGLKRTHLYTMASSDVQAIRSTPFLEVRDVLHTRSA
jgi:hypothetical protein